MTDANRPRVLIVDDHDENLYVLESILETLDVEVVQATSGKEALAASKDGNYALVLLDVQMPDMDGFETASLMRENEATRSVPIIFVTALGDDEDYVARGYEVGAVDYLTKPVKPKILRSKVRVFLDLYKRKRAVQTDYESLKAAVASSAEAPTGLLRTPSAGTPGLEDAPPAPPPSGVTDFEGMLRWALRDRYVIRRELGAGGMAVVFLADDLKQPRQVALKVLKGDVVGGAEGWQAVVSGGGTTQAERFLREVKVCATLSHPHILPLFDSGMAGGFPFYTMPYVDGGSVRDLMDREGKLPPTTAVPIVTEVLSALYYAHKRGIVHRDMKPDNVMLSDDHAVVADFGIARALGDGTDQRLTKTGFVAGTPAYMSPEQSMGQEVDGRSDVYSVGAVLYEMLSDELPFDGPTPQAIAAAVLTEEPKSILEHCPDLNPELADSVMRTLAKDREERFETAQAFQQALDAINNGRQK